MRVPLFVQSPRRARAFTAGVCAAAVNAAALGAQPESPAPAQPSAQPRTVQPAADERTVLERIRAAYLDAPTTERIRVSVRIGDLPPRRSLLLVRLEPATDAQSIRRAVIRAGRLLIEAEPRQVRAMLDSPDSPVFEAATVSEEIAHGLSTAFPPLPLLPLNFAAAAIAPPSSLTPYGAAAEFDSPELRQRSGNAVLTGRVRGGTFRLTVDASSGRIRRFELLFGDPAEPTQQRSITIEHAPSSAELTATSLSDPARKRVDTLAMLVAGEPEVAIGTPFASAPGSAAEAAISAALRGTSGKQRFAVLLLGGLSATGRTRPDAAPIFTTLNAIKAEFAAFSAGVVPSDTAAQTVDPGFAVLWHGADSQEDAALERLSQPDAGQESVYTAGIAGAESELVRIAPSSFAAFLMLAPDRTILALHPLEALPADPEQRIAELLMSLLDAAARYETDSKQGR